MNEVRVYVANLSHLIYVDEILKTIEESAKVRGTGIAKRKPEYIESIYDLDDYPGIKNFWQEYIETKWTNWAEDHKKWARIHRIYSDLFSIYQAQLRSPEEFELVICFGLLKNQLDFFGWKICQSF